MANVKNGNVTVELSFEDYAVIKKSVEEAYGADLLLPSEDSVARTLLRDFGVGGYGHG